MAMVQAGMSFSRIIFVAGAGYTGAIMMKNGKLSELLAELEDWMNKRGVLIGEGGEDDHSDAIAAQVRRLAMEVRQMASSRQITVLNNGSGAAVTSLLVPAATVGAVGYGYMWWKGLSFSDLMYVTKKNMSNAVSNLTKHLDQVTDALAAAKKHLTQRIENLDGKMDQQVEVSKLIRSEVAGVHEDISQIGYDLDSLHKMVNGLNGKIMTLEEKQDYTNRGVWYLCNVADGNKITGKAQEQFKIAAKSFGGYLPSGGGLSIEGVDSNADQPRALTRKNTVKAVF